VSTLKKYKVRLKNSKNFPLEVTIEAKSPYDARKIAEAQFPTHRFQSASEIKTK